MSDEKEGQTLGSVLGLGATREQLAPSPQEGEETLAAVQARIAALSQRMEELRAATEVEVLKAWQSPWKGEDMVKGKVDARLASNSEFRAVMTQCREAQALERQMNPQAAETPTPPAAGATGSSHPAVGR